MRIGIVTDWTTTGAGEVSSNLAKILLMQGNEVFIFARFDTYGKPMANVGQARIYWANNPFSPHAKAINKREIKRWVVENSIDLVLFNEQIWIAPVIWVKELGVLCVAYIDYYREDTVKNFQIYDGLICNTLRHLSVFNWHKGVIYIPWGVDPSVFSRRRRFEPLAPHKAIACTRNRCRNFT